jgi:hypothetical protein
MLIVRTTKALISDVPRIVSIMLSCKVMNCFLMMFGMNDVHLGT